MKNLTEKFSFGSQPSCSLTDIHNGWETPKLYSPSKIMQRHELGALDPALYMNEETEELYEQPPGHLGRIWFTLHYKTETEELKIALLKIRNLRFYRDPINGQEWYDFNVRLILDHDERRCYVTSIRKKNSNLNINETFSMQVAYSEIENHSIHIFVNCIDKHKHQKTVGMASFDLKLLKPYYDKLLRVFRDLSELENTEQVRDRSELLVALTYNSALERLTVGLFDVRKLPTKDKSSAAYNIFAKISLHQGLQCTLIKQKQSSLLSHGRAFNESFTFPKIIDLEHISVRIALYKQKFSINLFNKPIGFIVLGSDLFAKRRELEHWQEMINRPNEQVCYWHGISLVDD